MISSPAFQTERDQPGAGGCLEPFLALSDDLLGGLAERFGTPLFVFDRNRFEANCRSFVSSWNQWFPGGRVYYSYKTNHLPEACSTAHACAMGADVVSGYELEHARRLAAGHDIVFNGPMKTRQELGNALEAGALVNVDAIEDLVHLSEMCPVPLRVGLRVNPALPVYRGDDPSFDFEHRRQVRQSKFGWPISDGSAHAVASQLRAHGFLLESLHCQLGSQIDDVDRFVGALAEIARFAQSLRSQGYPIRRLNVGGGFPAAGMSRAHRGWLSDLHALIGHQPAESCSTASTDADFQGRFLKQLRGALDAAGLPDLYVDCEPGRVLISDAMVLLTRIQAVKHFSDHRWLVIDGGLNLLPTAAFGETRRVRFIRGQDVPGMPETADGTYSLGGPLCFEGDVVQRDVPVPAGLVAGSHVCLSDVGAYSVSRSTSFNQPRAAVVMLDGSDPRLIWRRETYADIFQFHV